MIRFWSSIKLLLEILNYKLLKKLPMKQAVISCLHANLPAVEAVLKDIELQGITNITCLGDLVGYGPQPNDCLLYTSPSPRDVEESRMPSSA